MKNSKKQIDKGTKNLIFFLKVFGFLDEDGQPTEKGKGSFTLDPEGELCIIKPKGEQTIRKTLMSKGIALEYIKSINIEKVSVQQVRNHLAIKRIL